MRGPRGKRGSGRSRAPREKDTVFAAAAVPATAKELKEKTAVADELTKKNVREAKAIERGQKELAEARSHRATRSGWCLMRSCAEAASRAGGHCGGA